MLEEEVLKTINKYQMIQNGDKIVVGVSGGPDSITLLNILNEFKEKLNINIYVAHINHMIRKEADEETKYVHDFCEKINVEFYSKKINVEEEAKKLKIGTEEAGRNIRYDFFEEVAKKVGANKIATAHNRPLIETSRKSIEEYCDENKLDPRYDKTNKENIYTRNKVRNLLIPYIQKEFNPNIIDGINRLSDIAKEEEEFLNNIVQKEYKRLLITEKNSENSLKDKPENGEEEVKVILNLKEFNKLDNVIKSRLILYTISKVYGRVTGIEKIHIDDIVKLCNNNIGNKYLTPKKGIKIYIKKGKIFFLCSSSFRRG